MGRENSPTTAATRIKNRNVFWLIGDLKTAGWRSVGGGWWAGGGKLAACERKNKMQGKQAKQHPWQQEQELDTGSSSTKSEPRGN